jgi:uncharacterized protein
VSQRFLNLIRKGETAEVAAAVNDDPVLVSTRDAQGISALLLAIYHQQPLIRDFLLSRLTEIDFFEAAAVGDCARLASLLQGNAILVFETSADGWGALHLSAAFGGARATGLLLEHGAHVHQFSRNPMHNQPLHACLASNRDAETARLLIAQGADVNTRQAGGFTPLHQASAGGAREIVILLLEAGADPGLTCDRGKTAADFARERGYAEIASLLDSWQLNRADSSTGS